MKLEIYKKGQGKHTRLWSAIVLAVVAGLGCYQLHGKLDSLVENLWVAILVPAGLFAVLALLVFWLVNKHLFNQVMMTRTGKQPI